MSGIQSWIKINTEEKRRNLVNKHITDEARAKGLPDEEGRTSLLKKLSILSL